MLKRLSLLLLILALSRPTAGAEERLPLYANINGQRATLALDTGSSHTALFGSAARRLGLTVKPPSAKAQAIMGSDAPNSTRCKIEFDGHVIKGRIPVFDVPDYLRLDIDGVVGWDFIRRHVIEIQGAHHKFTVSDQIPTDLSSWKCWTIRPDAPALVVRIPAAPGEPNAILIDTGDPGGVQLNQQRWQQWRQTHIEQSATLKAAYTGSSGLDVTEVCWAEDLTLGGVTFEEVPVSSGHDVAGVILGDDYVATLGLFALHRLHLVIDGEQGKVYLKSEPQTANSDPYDYNRLGAVFVPDETDGKYLVAHVVAGGPAHQAGIRNGDVLCAIDGLDATTWRTDPRLRPLTRFWSRPAGTTLHLSLRRDGRNLDAAAILQNIFSN